MILEQLSPVRRRIAKIIRSSLDFPNTGRVDIGIEPIPKTVLPAATIVTLPVSRELELRTAEETFQFLIVLMFPQVESQVEDEIKVARAQELGNALLTWPWNDLDCYLPQITEFSPDYSDSEDPKPYFSFSLTFQVQTAVNQ